MNSCVDLLSPPAWWCGLKYLLSQFRTHGHHVTTCVVVWIEIYVYGSYEYCLQVTTCVVVWIEIAMLSCWTAGKVSPPAWWCGLKFIP